MGDYPWQTQAADLAATARRGTQGRVENPPNHLVSTGGHSTVVPKRCCMPTAELSMQTCWGVQDRLPRASPTPVGLQDQLWDTKNICFYGISAVFPKTNTH